MYGTSVVRMLYFKNDKAHNLGDTPLPDGLVKVYRAVDKESHLSYEGACPTKYIPVDQEAELNLGPAAKVKVEPKLMKVGTSDYMFGPDRNVSGWDETEEWKVEVKNLADVPARVEVMRGLRHQNAEEVKRAGEFGQYEKVDMQRVKFTLDMEANSMKTFTYVVTYHEGERRERR